MSLTECPICQDKVYINNSIMINGCGHMICTPCWGRFLHSMGKQKLLKCPQCRNPIHMPSVFNNEKLTFINNIFIKDLRKENDDLRQTLIDLSNSNRKELACWKHNYKKFIIENTKFEEKESFDRLLISQEQSVEMLKYKTLFARFIRKYNDLRMSLNELTEGFIPSNDYRKEQKERSPIEQQSVDFSIPIYLSSRTSRTPDEMFDEVNNIINNIHTAQVRRMSS